MPLRKRAVHRHGVRPACPSGPKLGLWFVLAQAVCAAIAILFISGCGLINVGKFKWIEKTSSDENFHLVKDIMLTAHSPANPRTNFDHEGHEFVRLLFRLANEPNDYVTKSVWIDPNGQEFRTIRQSYNKRKEQDEGQERTPQGTLRIHSIPVRDLYDHKSGAWKVELYIDNKLARRLSFVVM